MNNFFFFLNLRFKIPFLTLNNYCWDLVLKNMVHYPTQILNILILMLTCVSGFCLEGLSLDIVPEVAHRGGDVRLVCTYDLGTSPLCYVKWYRGNFEFYRYTPSERPPHKVFPYPGIHVNVSTEF